MKAQNTSLSKFWLILSLAQLIFLHGFGKAHAAESTAPSTGSSALRISRSFFERSLEGLLTVVPAASSNRPIERQSGIAWRIEFPGGVPDINRDRLGCAAFKDLDSELCFLITTDVTSVGINPDETTARGLGKTGAALVQQENPELCTSGPIRSIAFANAEKSPGRLTVHYTGQCEGSPVALSLTLRQV